MRVLMSVFDKDKIEVLAKFLVGEGWEIVSTGGTASYLKSFGLPITDLSDVTGIPELLDGRVKTLHPNILAGILAKREKETHTQELEKHTITPIDMVVVNLYPFEKVVESEGVALDEALEMIDIGGVTLLRSAAKNYQHVYVVTDSQDIHEVINEISNQTTSNHLREKLAMKAFEVTQGYDFAIEKFFRKRFTGENVENFRLRNVENFGKYAENWHQQGKVGVWENSIEPSVIRAKQIHGKGLGYNNYLDADAALNVAKEVQEKPCVVIVKHGNPCGMAVANNSVEAFERAWQGDPVSSYGSVIAFNHHVEVETMQVICSRPNFQKKKGWFVEVMVAPGYTQEAIELVKSLPSKTNLRLLSVGPLDAQNNDSHEYRGIVGGLLIQERDKKLFLDSDLNQLFLSSHQRENLVDGRLMTVGVMTDSAPSKEKQGVYQFAISVCKHLKSNAISIVREYASGSYQLLGMGAGQPNRKDSTGKLAIAKAKENLTLEYHWLRERKDSAWEAMMQSQISDLNSTLAENLTLEEYIRYQFKNQCVVGSDAFFPFSDSVELLATEGFKEVIQPGGSINDSAVIDTANKYKMAMVYTGMRHFRH